ncbi:bifunctional glutamate N-acetyltransferase/amino-acid acetyltransferase ArgJ [bacterium]|nr:bifunctional glutamate N-acetyltransferase/amino-acid acetyltransferase ArgJ [bacterium]MBU1614906.1 bifunctional glutamate N-acetyltransferase/amino-acid acetyltransferase ArgJ [bacterium]
MEKIRRGITAAKGFRASGISCGIKEEGLDLALLYSDVQAAAAAVFTANKVKAAPVLISQQHIENGRIQAIVANSGMANCCTGEQGLKRAALMAELTAVKLNIAPESVLVASTGKIGSQLPMEKIGPGIKEAAANLSRDGGKDAARAIMTTDTRPKEAALEVELFGQKVTLGGMAKGAGMIHPKMATMLAFITTDALISPLLLKKALLHSVEQSFNMITVDGDMSTNDMVVILANGLAGEEIIFGSREFDLFQAALDELAIDLARQIPADGEGATKLLEIKVKGALTEEAARRFAREVVRYTEVKAAFYGADPNWGRIMAALGQTGQEIDPEKVDIYFEDQLMAKGGCKAPFDPIRIGTIMKQKEIKVEINLNLGQAKATAWGCDLSPEYVQINAHYRT